MKIAVWRHHSHSECPWRSTTVWTAGCRLHCPGCFNQHLWDPAAGRQVSLLYIAKRASRLKDPGLCLMGGEPFNQPWSLALSLLLVRLFYARLHITIFSGQTYEQLNKAPLSRLILHLCHHLVDGPFIAELADERLSFRGSANQRVIDLVRSRRQHRLYLSCWSDRLVISKDRVSGPAHLLDVLFNDLTPASETDCGRLIELPVDSPHNQDQGPRPEVAFRGCLKSSTLTASGSSGQEAQRHPITRPGISIPDQGWRHHLFIRKRGSLERKTVQRVRCAGSCHPDRHG